MKTIDIFGVIGEPWDGLTDRAIADQLKGHTGELTVRINSPGGYAYDGVAIYNILKDYSPRVEILGLAASAASVVAMAGSSVHLRTGAQLMIHDAWGGVMGGASDIRAYADHLDHLSESIADIYAARGVDRDQVRGLMKAETWFSGAEAVAAGLADSMEGESVAPPEETASVLAAMECRETLGAPCVNRVSSLTSVMARKRLTIARTLR